MSWSLKGIPFEVQRVALERSSDQKGYNWFLEQGLGKTAVALEDFGRLQRAGAVDHLIVISPNSLKGNWVAESKSWQSDAEFRMWDTPKNWQSNSKFRGNASVFNYEALISTAGDVVENLLKSRRCMVVLDESHRIKNPNSTVTRRILGQYAKDAIIKRCMSGTPMTNTVVDLWPQLRMAGALNGSNPVTFKKRFGIEVPGFKGHKKVIGVKNEEELQEIIASCGFRASKAEWSDLPEKLYREPIKVALPDKLKAHYQTMLEEFVVMVNDDTMVASEAVVGQYLKLQQISSGFIYDGDTIHRLIETVKLPKFQALMDVLDSNGQSSKTLVFAHYRTTCSELISNIEKQTGEKPAYLVGGMKPEEIGYQKDAFNSDQGPSHMVLQLSAGKEGHTLLGGLTKRCYTTCYYESNFNLGDRVQSEDRNHRYGQVNPVLYNDFSSSPIETKIIRAYQRKKALVDYVIDNRPRLTKDD